MAVNVPIRMALTTYASGNYHEVTYPCTFTPAGIAFESKDSPFNGLYGFLLQSKL